MSFRLEERRRVGARAEHNVWTVEYKSRALALADLASSVAIMEQVCRPLLDDDGTVLIPAGGRSPYAHDGTHWLVLVADSAPPPPPGAAEGAPSAASAGPTGTAGGAPHPAPSAVPVLAAGAGNRVRACALSGTQATSASHGDGDGGALDVSRAPRPQRPPQFSKPFTAADDVSLVSTDASASRPGWGSGRDVTSEPPGGFPVVEPLGPRLVEPAPLTDPALREPERVWISVRRTGIDRHLVLSGHSLGAGVFTHCSRSTRTGELLAADDPWIVEYTTPCPRCWPGGAR